jgi:RNA polymerase sigma-70 factor (ECF subfamily)
MDERQLVKKIIAGDDAAFQIFYESHKKRLERTAIHFLGAGHPAIPDVLQETFITCIPKLAQFRFESSLYTWLNHFTVNFCYQALNKGKKTLLAETEELEAWAKPKPGLPQEIRQLLYEAINELSQEHREVIKLKDLDGKTHMDIAEILKLAPGTVMSRLSRARKELRKLLEPKKAVLESLWSKQ